MRVPKKTILTVGLALMFAACARGPGLGDEDKLSKAEHQAYRTSVMEVQMDSIVGWMDSTRKVLMIYNRRIKALLALHPDLRVTLDTIPFDGDDPPPVPCPSPPRYCPW